MSERDLIKAAVREALAEYAQLAPCVQACRLTDDDVVFFKRLKNALDKAATGLGMAILLGILAAIGWVIKMGATAWRNGANP